jgi:hypothetical protein
VTATPDTLWPPNGKLVPVTTEVVIDNQEPGTIVQLVDVVSSEDDAASDRSPDIVIIDDFTFELRAERYGWGDGRTYTITYEVTTPCGASERFSATVEVAHDQGLG